MHFHQIKELIGSAGDIVEIDHEVDTTFDPPLRAIWIGTGGTLVVTGSRNTTGVPMENIADGTFISGVEIKAITASGTTASGLVGYR